MTQKSTFSALAFVGVLVVAGFFLGTSAHAQATNYPGIEHPADPNPTYCTQEAMQCPDGSWVGRSGPNCEFVCSPVDNGNTGTVTPPCCKDAGTSGTSGGDNSGAVNIPDVVDAPPWSLNNFWTQDEILNAQPLIHVSGPYQTMDTSADSSDHNPPCCKNAGAGNGAAEDGGVFTMPPGDYSNTNPTDFQEAPYPRSDLSVSVNADWFSSGMSRIANLFASLFGW